MMNQMKLRIFMKIDEHEYIIQGRMLIDEFNEALTVICI